MSRQSKHPGLIAALLLAMPLAACGVRGALVPPETGDVLIETSDSRAQRPAGTASAEAPDDDARFPPPEAVK